MTLNPQQVQRRNERRAAMSAEDRKLEAIETIADSMFDIKAELMSLNHHLAAIGRALPGKG
jgi:hypothetical protein